MHMSIIYGTTDKDEAKEMDQELKQGSPLNELIDIDEESLTSLIPEADYIIDNIPTEDDDVDNTIKSLGILQNTHKPLKKRLDTAIDILNSVAINVRTLA